MQASAHDVFHFGEEELLPLFCESFTEGVHRVCFDINKQLDAALTDAASFAQKKMYRKFRKAKPISAGVEFCQVRTSKKAVYLVSEQSEIWMYGRCSPSDLSSDGFAPNGSLKAPLPLPISKNIGVHRRITQLSVSDTHKLAIIDEREMFAWGDFNGVAELNQASSFVPACSEKRVYSTAAVCNNAALFIVNNKLYAHGQDREGRLGCGQKYLEHTTQPVLVGMPLDATKLLGVCCAEDFAMCWDYGGKLYVWGSGKSGRLGLGCRGGSYNYNVYSPTRLECLSEECIVAASCGETHGVALTKSRQVYEWGKEHGTTISFKNRPHKVAMPGPIMQIQASADLTVVVTAHGELYSWGQSRIAAIRSSEAPEPILLPNSRKTSEIAVSPTFLVVLGSAKQNLQLAKKSQSQHKKFVPVVPPVNFPVTNESCLVLNTVLSLNQINELHPKGDSDSFHANWKRFTRMQPTRKPYLTFAAAGVKRLSSKKLPVKVVDEYMSPRRQQSLYLEIVDDYLRTKPERKSVKQLSKAELSERLKKIRVHNARKRRVMVKHEGPTLYKLPQQLHKLLNRECLLYMFTYVGEREVERRRRSSTITLEKYMHGWLEIHELERKPRKMMCPEFAASIMQRVMVYRLQRTVRLRLITLKCHLRKIARVMLIYRQLTSLIKQSLLFLLDFLMGTQNKVGKGCALEKVVATMLPDADYFRKIRCRPNLPLLEQPFSELQTLLSAKLGNAARTDLPILPFSKHQYEIVLTEPSKFGLFTKHDRNAAELSARKRLVEQMLHANMQSFLTELQEYTRNKSQFIYNHEEIINKERARLLLLGKLPMNSQGEYVPFEDIKEELACKMPAFPKRPDLQVLALINHCDKWDTERNNFRRLFRRYTELVQEELEKYQR